MAKKVMPDDGMMDASYGAGPVSKPGDDTSPAQPELGKNEGGEGKQSVDEENAENAQILIPKKELPEGTKPGDICSFKVSEDHGEEFSLEYVKDEAPDKSNMEDNTGAEIAALDQKGME
jgi:hypothetical protein